MNVTYLEVPKTKLKTITTRAAIEQAARNAGGLIDEGGMSVHPNDEQMLTGVHKHGFIAAVTSAWTKHYPLILRPQHFWLMIAQAVAIHIDLSQQPENSAADSVRAKWVTFEGKKTLTVMCNEFVLGAANDWASVVSGKPDSFSAQIAANTVEGVTEVLSPGFSATTPIEDICQKIVVMDICKNFFSFQMSTMCGFPSITLEGTVEDWATLREAAERLLERCESKFATQWAAALYPVLDKFVAARAGAVPVDSTFWNSMCKRGGTMGSGASTWFNGWINIFFPYITKRPNQYCVPYDPSAAYVKEGLQEGRYGMGMPVPAGCQGPDCAAFGTGMSAAPVEWNYLGRDIPLEFNAGFVGATQDPDTRAIQPQVAWYITNKPKEDPNKRRHFPF